MKFRALLVRILSIPWIWVFLGGLVLNYLLYWNKMEQDVFYTILPFNEYLRYLTGPLLSPYYNQSPFFSTLFLGLWIIFGYSNAVKLAFTFVYSLSIVSMTYLVKVLADLDSNPRLRSISYVVGFLAGFWYNSVLFSPIFYGFYFIYYTFLPLFIGFLYSSLMFRKYSVTRAVFLGLLTSQIVLDPRSLIYVAMLAFWIFLSSVWVDKDVKNKVKFFLMSLGFYFVFDWGFFYSALNQRELGETFLDANVFGQFWIITQVYPFIHTLTDSITFYGVPDVVKKYLIWGVLSIPLAFAALTSRSQRLSKALLPLYVLLLVLVSYLNFPRSNYILEMISANPLLMAILMPLYIETYLIQAIFIALMGASITLLAKRLWSLLNDKSSRSNVSSIKGVVILSLLLMLIITPPTTFSLNNVYNGHYNLFVEKEPYPGTTIVAKLVYNNTSGWVYFLTTLTKPQDTYLPESNVGLRALFNPDLALIPLNSSNYSYSVLLKYLGIQKLVVVNSEYGFLDQRFNKSDLRIAFYNEYYSVYLNPDYVPYISSNRIAVASDYPLVTGFLNASFSEPVIPVTSYFLNLTLAQKLNHGTNLVIGFNLTKEDILPFLVDPRVLHVVYVNDLLNYLAGSIYSGKVASNPWWIWWVQGLTYIEPSQGYPMTLPVNLKGVYLVYVVGMGFVTTPSVSEVSYTIKGVNSTTARVEFYGMFLPELRYLGTLQINDNITIIQNDNSPVGILFLVFLPANYSNYVVKNITYDEYYKVGMLNVTLYWLTYDDSYNYTLVLTGYTPSAYGDVYQFIANHDKVYTVLPPGNFLIVGSPKDVKFVPSNGKVIVLNGIMTLITIVAVILRGKIINKLRF